MHVIGTAGHVDHGKSSLVRALTGTDPDRWIEERLRGMTLDLGFAHLRFDDGVEAGIIDVPGHERFLHNMLAGAAGMELLLLVIAANEGPRAQTREHLAILSFLHVRRAIVVLTKSDLVDAEECAITEAVVCDTVRGTVAEGAPIVAVSTLTGAGMSELRAAIHAELIALPARKPTAPPFLPVDRVFALGGHGTVVTGTLMQGRIAVGDQLVLQPSGKSVRVRSLQVFGTKRESVEGGMRVAANLPGVAVDDIVRGEVLASAEFVAHASMHVTFTPVPAALAMLRRRTPVRAYFGAAEILGTLVFEHVPSTTDAVSAVLHLRKPTIVFPEEAFVVRRPSPKDLLGGGTVGVSVRVAPALHAVAAAEDADVAAVLAALASVQLQAQSAAHVAALANVRVERVTEILDDAAASGRVRRVQRPTAYIDVAVADALLAHIRATLAAHHAAAPWSLGATSLVLSRASSVDESLLVRILQSDVGEARLAVRDGYYALLDFVPALTAEQRAFFDAHVALDPAQPYRPVVLDDVVLAVRRSSIAGLSSALDTLTATGALIKVGSDLYRGTQIAEIRARLEGALRREGQVTMAAFRDLVGTTRKYAVPLLEWFDAAGVTLRNGDVRVLRNRREPPAGRI
jgi:selenocysteine-specific elongation factor